MARGNTFKKTVKAMQDLGIFRAEFEPIIEIYADMLDDLNRIKREAKRKRNPVSFVTTTRDGGLKKSPAALRMEYLQNEIIAYSDRLGLNPKAYDKLDVKPGKKKKDSALKVLEFG